MCNSVILCGVKVPLAVWLTNRVGWLLADAVLSQGAAAISNVNPKPVCSDQGGKILYSFQSAVPKAPRRNGVELLWAQFVWTHAKKPFDTEKLFEQMFFYSSSCAAGTDCPNP